MFYAQMVGWSWQLAALLALDILHLAVVMLVAWPLWGVLPEWLREGRVVVVISLVPLQILCGGLCPIVWLQQCIVQGQADWFTQPFIYKWVMVISPWEVSEGVVSAGVIAAEAILVASMIHGYFLRGADDGGAEKKRV